jgi:hypothetical protein
MRISMPTFESLSINEELALLNRDTPGFPHTQAYLEPLIESILDRCGLTGLQREKSRRLLLDDVVLAAGRFLSDPKNLSGEYKFSTYFTWYVGERLNRS